jgi:hypothetical protein
MLSHTSVALAAGIVKGAFWRFVFRTADQIDPRPVQSGTLHTVGSGTGWVLCYEVLAVALYCQGVRTALGGLCSELQTI